MKLLILSIVLFAVHLVWTGNRLLDLYTISKRKRKILWTLFMLFVPLIGVIAYNLSMRRQKVSRKITVF